jgi:hypothetical protein
MIKREEGKNGKDEHQREGPDGVTFDCISGFSKRMHNQ